MRQSAHRAVSRRTETFDCVSTSDLRSIKDLPVEKVRRLLFNYRLLPYIRPDSRASSREWFNRDSREVESIHACLGAIGLIVRATQRDAAAAGDDDAECAEARVSVGGPVRVAVPTTRGGLHVSGTRLDRRPRTPVPPAVLSSARRHADPQESPGIILSRPATRARESSARAPFKDDFPHRVRGHKRGI